MQHAFIENTEHYLNTHLSEQPLAVQEWRRAHWAQFVKQGIPHQRQETWRYTNMLPFFKMKFATECSTGTFIPEALPLLQNRILIVDGKLVNPLPKGLHCSTLRNNPELVLPYLNSTEENASVLNDLNASLADEVILIQIPFEYSAPEALVLDHFIAENALPQSHHVRVIVDVKANAELTLVQRFTGQGHYAQNTVTDFRIAQGAQVNHTVLQQDAGQSIHTHTIFAKQARDSQYEAFSIALGARLARVDWFNELQGKGAHTRLDGLFIVGKHQHIDHHTRIDHLADDTVSCQLYRGILQGHGTGVFEGKIVVPPNVKGINAAQTNNNILLCEQAEINTKPELQIYSDDVKCAHGATVGRLDPDAMFFLQARGFTEAMARDCLTFAFAKHVLQRLPEAQREVMSAQVLATMPNLFDGFE